jgi:hypothetical protein
VKTSANFQKARWPCLALFVCVAAYFPSGIILPMVSVTVELPDDIAKLFGEKESLPRSVLEAARLMDIEQKS